MLLIRLVAQQPHLQKERNVHCLLVLNPLNSKYSAWRSRLLFDIVVNDSSSLPILTLVALETVQSWLPQVLLAELEVGVHQSLRVGSAVALCCLPGVNNKPSSRQVCVRQVRQGNAGSGSRPLAHSSC